MGTVERWRPIPNCDGYEVSDLGRVVSLRRKRPLVMKASASPQGYGYVTIGGGRAKPLRRGVHQLVLLAFVGPPPEGQIVRHLDGQRLNNVLTNLAYGTHAENTEDSLRHGTHYNAGRIECRYGHPLDMANSRQRRCSICKKASNRASAQRARERQRQGAPKPVATHCKRNHPFDEANTMWVQGYRRCKACQKLRQQKTDANEAARRAVRAA